MVKLRKKAKRRIGYPVVVTIAGRGIGGRLPKRRLEPADILHEMRARAIR